jgi:hypothetical protein
MSVQQVGHATVDTPAAVVEDTSLATSRWCRSQDCRRRATSGPLAIVAIVVAGAIILVFPLPVALTLAFAANVGVEAGGGGAA